MAKRSGKTTIHDIAYALGLNASTVSRALADNPVVSQKTRDLIKEKAKELNYQPNRMAAALRRGRSDILGVIIPAIDRHFFSSVIRGIESKANDEGYHIIVCQSYDSHTREREMVDTLRRIQVDAIMISAAKDEASDLHFFQELAEGDFPVHFFDNVPSGLEAQSVVIDDEAGGYLATKHLLDAGYRHVAHLRGPQHVQVYYDRYLGYQRALREAGIGHDDRLVVDISSHFDSGEQAFNALWERPLKPDAIFSASDFSAAGGMRAAAGLGLNVPEDMAFVGFANEPFTEMISPQITSVDQQTMEMGRLTAERVLTVLNGDKATIANSPQVVLSPRVIVRESSRRQPK